MKIGLYGGTFSPPHLGHYRAAASFLSEFKPDILLIMPTFVPPHKASSPYDDPRHRYEMARLAFEPLCRGGHAEVSRLELDRGGVSYTADTLRELYGIYGLSGEHGVYLLMGTDMFLSLDKWREPETVFSLSHIVYASRELGDGGICAEKRAYYESEYGAAVDRLPIAPLEMSSTVVREAIRRGDPVDDIVSPAVLEYIKKAGLYGYD